jgi:ElaB/YqjD/DUF883 family membrane-anchored ribosome-binding protein
VAADNAAPILFTLPSEGKIMTTATTNLTNGLTGSDPISNAAGRAHQMVDNMVDKAAPAVQSASMRAHDTIDKVATAGSAAADWAATNGAQLADKSGALAEAGAGYVRARPLVSVAGALAIGYFLGRVMR